MGWDWMSMIRDGVGEAGQGWDGVGWGVMG